LFHSGWADWAVSPNELFNPVLLTTIELPDGQQYQFSYNEYGEIESIKYPTGGKEVFTLEKVAALGDTSTGGVSNKESNRGVTSRKVYTSENSTTFYNWSYLAEHINTRTEFRTTTTNPDLTKTERYIYKGVQNRSETNGSWGYSDGLAGMAYKEQSYNSIGQMISKKLTLWTKKSVNIQLSNINADIHPRVALEESIIYDNYGNGISASSRYEYEGDEYQGALNLRETPVLQKKSSQYAFVTAGSPLPATPLRTSETLFLQSDPNVAQTVKDIYKAQNMVGLATASVVKDASGTIVSRSEMLYDESGYSPNVGRGNPTTSRVWDSTKGLVTNADAYISTRAKFDTYGNQYESIDAKGNATTTVFDAGYHAFPISVTTAVPDTTGVNGSSAAFTTTATFNFTTGLPLTTTDANGLESRIEYDPATLRPLRTKTFYQNTQVGSQSETIYNDEPNNYWVKSRTQIDAQNWAESITYFDGLGRAYKSEEVDAQGNIFTEKEFDAQGRVKRVTNPFRLNETKIWTTNVYDEASRVKEVILPDGAKVKTDYDVSVAGSQIGIAVTVTDQANKQRRSITNALGQLARIDEPNVNGILGAIDAPAQPTFYNYNGIGKMTKVQQGVQNRYFLYDSLGRLLRVRQPEQNTNSLLNTSGNPENNSWSAGFTYDDNGNILSATDAKGVAMNYAYDNLNRIKTRSYSDSTPTVSYKYDNLQFGKGKLIETGSSVSTSKTVQFNNLGNVTSYQQITDGQTYTSNYEYSPLGVLLSETYPSGRQVKYDTNANGKLSRVWGQNGTAQKTYANAFTYNSSGAVEKLKLGNGKWEAAKFNNRLQITELSLGNGTNDASLWKTNFEYGEVQTNGTIDITKNAGNIAKQTLTIAGMTNSIVQTYKYDSLDRITEAKETSNNQQNWVQNFDYDRYGNRTSFNQFVGSAQTNQTPTIDTNTNRFTTGQGYTYDFNGNLITDTQNRQFIFNGDNKQTEVRNLNIQTSPTTPDANLIGRYLYDGEGKRVKKISATETTVFVYNGGGALVAEYSTALSNAPTTSYLTSDGLGSVRVITDALGQVVSRRDFMPFGEELNAGIGGRSETQKYSGAGQDNVRKRFTGYEKDTETGLDFAEARYYNNAHGRFTAVDPLLASGKSGNPQSFNRYAYTMNNPTNLVDPSGLIPEINLNFYCMGCGGNPYKRQDLDLPDDLNRDLSRERRPLPSSNDWKIGNEISLVSTPEVNVSREMRSALFNDATMFFNRGVKEAQLHIAAQEEIRLNTKSLEDWNSTSQFGEEPLFESSGEVGSEICIGNPGKCNDGDLSYTRVRFVVNMDNLPAPPLEPVREQLTLSFSAVRAYNSFVRETNSLLESSSAVRSNFNKRFSKDMTTVYSGNKTYRAKYGTFARAIWDDIMRTARQRGNKFSR
jgi:RHS repeat-associated protein